MTAFHRLGDFPSMASALDGLSNLAADQDAPANAAIGYGAADAIRETLGTPRMPDEEAIVTGQREKLRAALGPDELDRLTGEGHALEADAALAWALEAFAEG